MTPDFAMALKAAGHIVDVIDDFECSYSSVSQECYNRIEQAVIAENYDLMASFNYIPRASDVGEKYTIPYVAWMYDIYQTTLYTKSIYNSCNYIFVFDSEEYAYLKSIGVKKVWYMPLAVNTRRIGMLDITQEDLKQYSADVAFVGKLYCDPSVNGYNLIRPFLKPETTSQLDEMFRVMTGSWKPKSASLLRSVANVDYAGMVSLDAMDSRDLCSLDDARYYTATAFSKRLTQLDRTEALQQLGRQQRVRMYTFETPEGIGKNVEVRPGINYMNVMPKAFYLSKININITLRSISCGIPLRVFDILGSGGFLITNRQPDMNRYFEEDVDYVAFESIGELVYKTQYYLQHESERLQIAANGYRKVTSMHTYDVRVAEILDKVTTK
jgi:spore maturation protein CgeB